MCAMTKIADGVFQKPTIHLSSFVTYVDSKLITVFCVDVLFVRAQASHTKQYFDAHGTNQY